MSIATDSSPNPHFEFGDRVRKVRRDVAHMTQTEMAEAIGVTQKAYAAWESGGKPGDIVAVAKRIEELWPGRVTAAWVIGVEPPEPPHPARDPHRSGTPLRLSAATQPSEVDEAALAYVKLSDSLPNISRGGRAQISGYARRTTLASQNKLWQHAA